MRSRSDTSFDIPAARKARAKPGADLRLVGGGPEDLQDASGPMVLRVPDMGRQEESPGVEPEPTPEVSAAATRDRGERLTMLLTLSALLAIVSALAIMIWSSDPSSQDSSVLTAAATEEASPSAPTESAASETVSTIPPEPVRQAADLEPGEFGVSHVPDMDQPIPELAEPPSAVVEAPDVVAIAPEPDGDLAAATNAGPSSAVIGFIQDEITGRSAKAISSAEDGAEGPKDIDALLARVESALADRQTAESEYATAADALDNLLESHRSALLEAEKMLSFARERELYEDHRYKRAEVLVRKGHLSAVQRNAIAFALDRARIEVAQAQANRDRLAQGPAGTECVELQAKRDAAAARLQSTRAKYMVASAELERESSSLEDPWGRGGPSYAEARTSTMGATHSMYPLHKSSSARPMEPSVKVADRRPGPAAFHPSADPRLSDRAAEQSRVIALPDLATETTYDGDSR